MTRSRSTRRDLSRSSGLTTATEDESQDQSVPKYGKQKRMATVYDAVAGRIGVNGFLTSKQLDSSNVLASTPEEVLLRRVSAPAMITYDFYNADERLDPTIKLPDSDLLKAIHAYASDFYAATIDRKSNTDHHAFDETALLALGVLLEEASKEVLGETGDMALVEPEGMENELLTSKMTEYQIIGKVKSRQIRQRGDEQHSSSDERDDLEVEESPRKRIRATR